MDQPHGCHLQAVAGRGIATTITCRCQPARYSVPPTIKQLASHVNVRLCIYMRSYIQTCDTCVYVCTPAISPDSHQYHDIVILGMVVACMI